MRQNRSEYQANQQLTEGKHNRTKYQTKYIDNRKDNRRIMFLLCLAIMFVLCGESVINNFLKWIGV